jgi:hypothetical protein
MTEPNDERMEEPSGIDEVREEWKKAALRAMELNDEVAALRGENERLRSDLFAYPIMVNSVKTLLARAEKGEAEVERLRGLLEAERLGRARCLLQFSEVEAERDALKEELSGNDAAHRLALAELAALRDEEALARPLLEAVQDCPLEALDERCGVMKGTYTGAILHAALSYRQAKGEKE